MATPTTAPPPAPILSDPNPGVLRGLLHGFYDFLWLFVIVVASPWWAWRCLRDEGFRTMVRQRLGWTAPRLARSGRPRVLVHGVSVGEVKSAAALVRMIRERDPETDVVISTTTDTGLEVARKLYPELTVVRFPLDLGFCVGRFLARIAPSVVVLVELEIWPNFLRACNRKGLPIAVVNGRIRSESYSSYRVFRFLPQFNRISLFCVQQDEYAKRFLELSGDPGRVLVTGNLKIDGLDVGQRDPGEELVQLLGGRPDQPVLVGGSTHEPEERLLIDAWREATPEARLILVPRHPPRAPALVEGLDAAGIRVQRLTRLRAGAEEPDATRPVVVDTVGELERIYGLADLVFVGGSLIPHGGQNMLEPAAAGCPVLYGPSVENFVQEASLLEQAGASRRLADAAELPSALRECLDDAEGRERMGRAGLEAVKAQGGATELTFQALAGRCLRPGGGHPWPSRDPTVSWSGPAPERPGAES